MSSRDLTAETLREYLSYDPETGVFTWRISRGCRKAGSVAGSYTQEGYLATKLFNRHYLMHRLAWLHVYGVWPCHELDHINGRKDDNRIVNLRDVLHCTNSHNVSTPKGINPFLGVSFETKPAKWRAQISINRKNTFLGYFDTPEEAHAAYVEAKRKLHAGCTI